MVPCSSSKAHTEKLRSEAGSTAVSPRLNVYSCGGSHLQAGLPPGPFQGWPAHCVPAGKNVQGCQRAPGRHPGRLQRPPLVPGDPGDERQVVVAAPAVFAQVVPAADHAVLHRLRVGIFRRSRSRDG